MKTKFSLLIIICISFSSYHYSQENTIKVSISSKRQSDVHPYIESDLIKFIKWEMVMLDSVNVVEDKEDLKLEINLRSFHSISTGSDSEEFYSMGGYIIVVTSLHPVNCGNSEINDYWDSKTYISVEKNFRDLAKGIANWFNDNSIKKIKRILQVEKG